MQQLDLAKADQAYTKAVLDNRETMVLAKAQWDLKISVKLPDNEKPVYLALHSEVDEKKKAPDYVDFVSKQEFKKLGAGVIFRDETAWEVQKENFDLE